MRALVLFEVNHIKFGNRKYKLGRGSELLRVSSWNQIHQMQLKSLIHRFATREAHSISTGKPFYFWRVKRLGAVAVYESRFGGVPELFKKRSMPKLKSYYVNNGVYLWPSPKYNALN